MGFAGKPLGGRRHSVFGALPNQLVGVHKTVDHVAGQVNRIHLAVLGERNIVPICFLQTTDALITIMEDVPPGSASKSFRIIEP